MAYQQNTGTGQEDIFQKRERGKMKDQYADAV